MCHNPQRIEKRGGEGLADALQVIHDRAAWPCEPCVDPARHGPRSPKANRGLNLILRSVRINRTVPETHCVTSSNDGGHAHSSATPSDLQGEIDIPI